MAFQTKCICHKFFISLTNYFVMVLTICGKWLGWLIIQRLTSRSSNEHFLYFKFFFWERKYPELSILLQLLKYLKVSFFANIDNLLKASDQSAAPVSQSSWIQIPYRPEFFFFSPYFYYCSSVITAKIDFIF